MVKTDRLYINIYASLSVCDTFLAQENDSSNVQCVATQKLYDRHRGQTVVVVHDQCVCMEVAMMFAMMDGDRSIWTCKSHKSCLHSICVRRGMAFFIGKHTGSYCDRNRALCLSNRI